MLRLDQTKTLTNNAMLDKLRIDGVYVDRDPTMQQISNDSNVLRLE